MADFNETSVDLPSVDKDGNAITESNPLELEDVTVEKIASTDLISAPNVYVPRLRKCFLRDIYLEDRLAALKAILALMDVQLDGLSVPPSTPDAEEEIAGIAEIANQTEGRSGTNHERILTSLRYLDALRNSSVFAATDTRKGVSEKANQIEGRGGIDDSRFLTSLRFFDALRNGSNFAASTTRKGVFELAKNSEFPDDENDRNVNAELAVTPAGLLHFFQNYEYGTWVNMTLNSYSFPNWVNPTISAGTEYRSRTEGYPRRVVFSISFTELSTLNIGTPIWCNVSWTDGISHNTSPNSVSISGPLDLQGISVSGSGSSNIRLNGEVRETVYNSSGSIGFTIWYPT